MAFSRLSTGRSQTSLHSAEFACELGGKVGGIVAITRAPLARTMSGNVVDPIKGLAEVPLNHSGAPPSRRSKRTMSQIRRVCPPDAQLKRMIRKVLLADPDMRFGSAVTMATRQRCMKQLEDECGCSLKHKTGFIHKELERISLGSNGNRGRATKPASTAEATLMSELKSTLQSQAKASAAQIEQTVEAQSKESEHSQEQDEEADGEAMPLGRTTSELEHQLKEALDSAQDVLQHTEHTFETQIPSDAEQQNLPDLISPDPRPDDEEQAEDESYITVTSEEVSHACGDLLQDVGSEVACEAAAQQAIQLTAANPEEFTKESGHEEASPIDQLSALRERLRQIRDTTDNDSDGHQETISADTARTDADAKAKDETASESVEAATSETTALADDAAGNVEPAATEAEVEVAETVATQAEETSKATELNFIDYRKELEQKSRKELQKLAKEHGVKANLSSCKIIDALCEYNDFVA